MHDVPLEAHEHTEHLSENHGSGHDPFVARVAVLVSALAVLAAVSGSLESLEASKTLATASEATLNQDEATDAWAEYQADSLKRHLYTIMADVNPAQKDKYLQTAKENADKQNGIKVRARKAEAERTALMAASATHEGRHHWLTGAATLFEVAIALSTVSIITRRNWLWIAAAGLSVVGLALLTSAYL